MSTMTKSKRVAIYAGPRSVVEKPVVESLRLAIEKRWNGGEDSCSTSEAIDFLHAICREWSVDGERFAARWLASNVDGHHYRIVNYVIDPSLGSEVVRVIISGGAA